MDTSSVSILRAPSSRSEEMILRMYLKEKKGGRKYMKDVKNWNAFSFFWTKTPIAMIYEIDIYISLLYKLI